MITRLILGWSPVSCQRALIHGGMDSTRPWRSAVLFGSKMLATDPLRPARCVFRLPLFVWYIPQMLDWTEIQRIWRSSHNDKFFVVPLKAFLNHFATRRGALFCWNRQQPSGNTASLKGWTCSASASRSVRGYSARLPSPPASMSLIPPRTLRHWQLFCSRTTFDSDNCRAGTSNKGCSSDPGPVICHHYLALVTPPQILTLAHFFLLPTHQHWGHVGFLCLSNPRNHSEESLVSPFATVKRRLVLFTLPVSPHIVTHDLRRYDTVPFIGVFWLFTGLLDFAQSVFP